MRRRPNLVMQRPLLHVGELLFDAHVVGLQAFRERPLRDTVSCVRNVTLDNVLSKFRPLRFVYISGKTTSLANYCIVPGCASILKQCLSGKRSKKKNRFHFHVRSDIKQPLHNSFNGLVRQTFNGTGIGANIMPNFSHWRWEWDQDHMRTIHNGPGKFR